MSGSDVAERECRVAIVDDDAAFRTLVRLTVECEPGMRVVAEACDGREAIEYVERLYDTVEQPDVVTLDLDMPRVDGYRVLERLTTSCPLVQVIVYTGAPDPDVDRLRELGARIERKGASLARLVEQLRAVRSSAPEPGSDNDAYFE